MQRTIKIEISRLFHAFQNSFSVVSLNDSVTSVFGMHILYIEEIVLVYMNMGMKILAASHDDVGKL